MKVCASPKASRLNLAEVRARLAGETGPRYWRSLEELAATPEFEEMMHREFPDGASDWLAGVSRRSFLRMAAASLALAGVTACTKQPHEAILPYVRQPEEIVPGETLQFASSMVLNGYATGILGKSREGHPFKIEGSPEHPSSLGGSSVWMQASILDLYDPDRSQALVHQGDLSSWNAFVDEARVISQAHQQDQGAGLRFLTETMSSPSVSARLEKLLKRFPRAKWSQFDPVTRDHVREGARLAFGSVLEPQYRFDRAKVIVSFDADFLYEHPQRLRHTRQFADGRRVSAGQKRMNRLYVAESSPTVTGTMADHRLPVGTGHISELVAEIVRRLNKADGTGQVLPWLEMVVQDLQKFPGESVVLAGPWQTPEVHALCHWLNQQLGNTGQTVYYTPALHPNAPGQLASLTELAGEIQGGAISTLLILDANPVYHAPADLEFSRLLKQVPRTVHLGTHFDETAAACLWHIPQAHYLEAWGDATAPDGTVSIIQPLIAPLYDGKTIYQVLGLLDRSQPEQSDYEALRSFWMAQQKWDDEKPWRRAVHDGFIAGTAGAEQKAEIKTDGLEAWLNSIAAAAQPNSVEIVFRPDPSLWDGRFANNGWLQESPKPISKLVWDNPALISPALAEEQQLSNGDLIEVAVENQRLRLPVWIMPGQAEKTITLWLGGGRPRAGRVGNGAGFNTHHLRTLRHWWRATGVTLTKTAGRYELATTQTHHQVDDPERQVLREQTWPDFQEDPDRVRKSIESPKPHETLYREQEYPYSGYKWGMSIDLTTCIGCNACLIACNAENNIPVVGKKQVLKSREMHWIRIDTYYQGSPANPRYSHMPVPCMHCEHAPCELVCPVAATVHDHEGLNLQVYNRCVGTRFCSNNCPYKVRRFNFLAYADYKTPSQQPRYNPEVTVRWRGVMEKCTYCIQRISDARIRAEKENRAIGGNEIQTACQQACPASAIVFGNLNDPQSPVTRLKQHPLDYPMLGQLNTRPRTTYLARVTNPRGNESSKPKA